MSGNGDCTNRFHLQFVEDMEEAGLEVQHYRGRFYWEGPAVAVDDLQDALGATKVRCQWDHLGLGWIVYPKADGQRPKHRRGRGAGLMGAELSRRIGLFELCREGESGQ